MCVVPAAGSASADNIHKLEGDCYCSRACASFVQQLAVQLVDPMARIRPTALQKYLARPSHRPQQGVAAQGGGVETMKAVIEVSPWQQAGSTAAASNNA